MLRNYLITALRNLIRNRLYAAIKIVGLSLGFAAALLIALYVQYEFSYDTWIPGHDDVYMFTSTRFVPGRSPFVLGVTAPDFARRAKLELPFVEASARLVVERSAFVFRANSVEARERIWWADPDLFSVLALKPIAGDLKNALRQPDGIVFTRKLARKYFGTDAPIGKTIEINRQHVLRVTAVIDDLPQNSSLPDGPYLSGLAAFSRTAQIDSMPRNGIDKPWDAVTYVRVKPGISQEQVDAAVAGLVPPPVRKDLRVSAVRLTDLHFRAPEGFSNASLPTIYGFAAIALLFVVVGCVNFIGLSTALAARRAVEVGVRKVSGAQRTHLVAQFIGESFVYVVIATGVALMLTALVLPSLDAFMNRPIGQGFWHEGRFLLVGTGFICVLSILGGLYPALVQSKYRAAAVLKSHDEPRQAAILRRALVVIQFSVLIGLILVTAIIYRQTAYATQQLLRTQGAQVLMVRMACSDGFKQRVTTIPGVVTAACSTLAPLENSIRVPTPLTDGRRITLYESPIDFGFFELYGIHPLAGRLFSRTFGSDAAPESPLEKRQPPVVLNETAARQLGFTSPEAAIGKTLPLMRMTSMDENFVGPSPAQIVGVVPDFPIGSIRERIGPTVFYVDPNMALLLNVKIDGNDITSTLKAIEQAWRQSNASPMPDHFFLDQAMQAKYSDVSRESVLFAAFSVAAVMIACLGLFGHAAFIAESRTKEIGIRKAMGASRADVLRMLLWEFAKPVLLANLIAWPTAGYLMHRWLQGFAYHVRLDPLIFVGASAIALVIAFATVMGHALLVARGKPVVALRYE